MQHSKTGPPHVSVGSTTASALTMRRGRNSSNSRHKGGQPARLKRGHEQTFPFRRQWQLVGCAAGQVGTPHSGEQSVPDRQNVGNPLPLDDEFIRANLFGRFAQVGWIMDPRHHYPIAALLLRLIQGLIRLPHQ
jgi:hypothetical protein